MGHQDNIRLRLHEQVHIEQQKAIGFHWYMWKYLTNKYFRYQVEFEAYSKGSGLALDEASKIARTYM
jgi:hypothetical protein